MLYQPVNLDGLYCAYLQLHRISRQVSSQNQVHIRCCWYLCSNFVGVQVHSCDGAQSLGAAASTQPGSVADGGAFTAAGAHSKALSVEGPGNHRLPHQAQHLP